jgi:hypothetical protein
MPDVMGLTDRTQSFTTWRISLTEPGGSLTT